jgi:hypothetical protein
MQADDLHRAEHAYRLIDALGLWMPVFAVLASAGSVAAARRRRRALAWLAVGLAVGAIGLAGLMRFARGQVVDAASGDAAVARAVWDILVVDLRNAVRVAVLTALGVWIVVWLSGPSMSAVAVRAGGARLASSLGRHRVDRTALALVRGLLVVIAALTWLI